MKSQKDRLKTFIKYKGLTDQQFIGIIGAKRTYISSMVNGVGKYEDKIFESFPDLNRIWLLTGEGEMLNAPAETSEAPKPAEPVYADKVPLLPVEAIAGLSVGFADGVNIKDCRLISTPFPGSQYAIQVSGESMTPEIKSGEIIYVKRIDERAFIPWGNIVVLDTANGALVKEIQPCDEDDDFIMAISCNPKFRPYRIEKTAIYGIYKVLGKVSINSTL